MSINVYCSKLSVKTALYWQTHNIVIIYSNIRDGRVSQPSQTMNQ